MSNLAVRQEDLAAYASYAQEYNEPQTIDFPKLQIINKEGRDGFGEWYVGRKFEGRLLAIPGDKIVAGIIVGVYNQYSYFDKTTNTNLCRSPLFKSYPNGVRGSKFGFECGGGCPHAKKENKLCKMQKVVFMIAITSEGKRVPCRYYAKGKAFMPLVEYLQKSQSQIINGNHTALPTFAFVTELGTREEVNGDTCYYVPVFKMVTPLLPVAQMDELAGMAKQVADYVASAKNAPHDDDEEAAPPVPQTAYATPAPVAPKTTYQQREDMKVIDDIPWPTTNPPIDAQYTPVGTGGGGSDDLASVINSALGL